MWSTKKNSKKPGSDLVLAEYVRFWPDGSSPEISQCAVIARPASAQSFRADPDWIRSGVLTGLMIIAVQGSIVPAFVL